MEKSAEAFRTISEVAEWLGVPTHVLRFWESRFTQVKPVKRAGGRRYYRPSDMALLGGIRRLLHDDGVTIRGVQKILREKGVKHVAALSPGGPEPADEAAWPDTPAAAPAEVVALAGRRRALEPAPDLFTHPSSPSGTTPRAVLADASAPADNPDDDTLSPPHPHLVARLGNLGPTAGPAVGEIVQRLMALRERMANRSAAAE